MILQSLGAGMKDYEPGLSRRTALLAGAALAAAAGARAAEGPASGRRAEPFPLGAVRLTPSIWADAVAANRRYLLSLDPDRLLHNFRAGAGLAPKGELYGGWEARGIAGHTLGHHLSALSLLHAQTGDAACKARAAYIVSELAACQSAHGDGYVGGTTVERDGRILDGKVVYEELRRHDVHAGPFDLNGGWVPLYTWHKVHQGLLDADALCGDRRALKVLVGMSDYLVGVLSDLSDAEVQTVLSCEHGGLNEAFAETYQRTGDARYLALARRLHDNSVLDALEAGRNELEGKHANTQIPKVIGLARLYEVTGEPRYARAARFFWSQVTGQHSYVIGGNSEREHFQAPGVISQSLTDRTCEGCNSYNMLKLTRRLYAWEPKAAWFDWYERTHLNHTMAQQRPSDGMFTYMTPMLAGSARQFSTPTESFWCCMGSGMESHAKHGDSIYWRAGDRLFVNLFIPSILDWSETGARIALETGYPASETVRLNIARAPRGPMELALRLPAWSAGPRLSVNGAPVPITAEDGYAIVRRRWRDGDLVELTLPMPLRMEPTPDNPDVVAFLSGPLVLAADLGPATRPLAAPAPAFVTEDLKGALRPAGGAHLYKSVGMQPGELTLRPFFGQYDRRTAIYFPRLSEAAWRTRADVFAAEQVRLKALDVRTVDVIHPGEAASEQAHGFGANQSDVTSYAGRAAREAWWGAGHWIEWDMAVRPDRPMTLQALYWGEEVDKDFEILIDGQSLAIEARKGNPVREFVTRDYPVPPAWTRGRRRVRVRVLTHGSDATVYECRMLQPQGLDA
ncbi:MAG: glycoside hydrolase family 127 protein [Phenylobacterium sp.]|nr:MAG: glycoside hydrolase family 127 protein [Phenylobacterium sp.]